MSRENDINDILLWDIVRLTTCTGGAGDVTLIYKYVRYKSLGEFIVLLGRYGLCMCV